MRLWPALLFILICSSLQSQPPSPTPAVKRNQPKQPAAGRQEITRTDEHGTEQSPIVVKVLPPAKTKEETANDKAKDLDQSAANWWMVRLTGAIVFVGIVQTIVFWLQARRLKQTINKMDAISAQQTTDLQASIAEATRAAKAMEGIAASMATNVEELRVSVGISREIADTQKLVTELQSRPYLSVAFEGAIFQDANHLFEVQAIMRNHGNTPAYDVTFRSAAGIVPFPLPDDFDFPLPDASAGTSVSFLAPGTHKLITRTVLGRVHDGEVESIKHHLPPRCLAMWGVVKYRDAFFQITKKSRQLRFAFIVSWLPWVKGMDIDKDGNPRPEQQFSHDTTHHNDAD